VNVVDKQHRAKSLSCPIDARDQVCKRHTEICGPFGIGGSLDPKTSLSTGLDTDTNLLYMLSVPKVQNITANASQII